MTLRDTFGGARKSRCDMHLGVGNVIPDVKVSIVPILGVGFVSVRLRKKTPVWNPAYDLVL